MPRLRALTLWVLRWPRRRVSCGLGGDYQNAYRVVKHAALWARRENVLARGGTPAAAPARKTRHNSFPLTTPFEANQTETAALNRGQLKRGENLMARVPGRLLATLLSNGTVVETFLPDKTTGNANPIRAKDIGTAERDFVWTFGLTRENAARAAAELERNKHVDIACDVDEAVLPKLCVVRAAGV